MSTNNYLGLMERRYDPLINNEATDPLAGNEPSIAVPDFTSNPNLRASLGSIRGREQEPSTPELEPPSDLGQAAINRAGIALTPGLNPTPGMGETVSRETEEPDPYSWSARKAFMEHLRNMPQYKEPDLIHNIAAALGGAGAGWRQGAGEGLAVSEGYRQLPYKQQLGRWQAMTEPLLQASNLEEREASRNALEKYRDVMSGNAVAVEGMKEKARIESEKVKEQRQQEDLLVIDSIPDELMSPQEKAVAKTARLGGANLASVLSARIRAERPQTSTPEKDFYAAKRAKLPAGQNPTDKDLAAWRKEWVALNPVPIAPITSDTGEIEKFYETRVSPGGGGPKVMSAGGAAGGRRQGLPSGELDRRTTLNIMTDFVKDITTFSEQNKDSIGPAAGPIESLKQRTVGSTPEKTELFRMTNDIGDMLLRARSGQQINETEYRRLKRLVPDPWSPYETFQSNLNGFKKELNIMLKSRGMEGKTQPGAGEVGPTPEEIRKENIRKVLLSRGVQPVK